MTRGWKGLALAFAVLLSAACQEPPFQGTLLEPALPAEDFVLHDQNGHEFRLSEHRGQVVMLFFGYIHCPDVCPVTLSTWARVEKALGDEAERVRFVFVTVDPERDTAEKLREHLEIFSDDFVGLTGSREELEPVYDSFGIFRETVPVSTSAAGYLVDHTTRILVIDPEGRLRLLYGFDAPADAIARDVRRLLGS